MSQVRLLGALRESKKREWSDSFEGQEADVVSAARRVDGTLVHFTRDRDVSGREVPLFKRPQLKKWLDKPRSYDGITVQSMSRLTRRPADIYLFLEWCDEHGKFLVTHKESIDTRTEGGRRMAELFAMVASWEWDEIQARTKSSSDRAREAGRWHGGMVPYGYRVVGSKGNWSLVPNDIPTFCTVTPKREWTEVQVILDLMIPWFLFGDSKALSGDKYRGRVGEGWSYNRISEELHAMGVPTSRGFGLWTNTTVRKILTSRINLLGEDKDGRVRAAALIKPALFQQIQREAETRTKGPREKPVRRNANPLAKCIECQVCRRGIYYMARPDYKDGTPHLGIFHCSTTGCPVKTIAGKEVFGAVNKNILLWFMDEPRYVKKVEPGIDHTAEIEDAKKRMARLRRQDENGDWEDDPDGYRRRMNELRASVKKFEKNPVVPDKVTYEPTGEVFGEVWSKWSWHERGAELRANGVTVLVGRNRHVSFEFNGHEADTLEALFAGIDEPGAVQEDVPVWLVRALAKRRDVDDTQDKDEGPDTAV
ncbi:recombinase family protein [Streptomyces sp. NBC_00237]|uniref:recombinase family protein n=1 Tax=Streptomyces sp. NBC_00237 TaxID=2975687 RepID=UPI00224FD4DC|nr:recombinase family protein [Streptomyces sp. NBC_00237]MCX5203012.1 recombinase family protein [Streptomyces sp. NBC_00237]